MGAIRAACQTVQVVGVGREFADRVGHTPKANSHEGRLFANTLSAGTIAIFHCTLDPGKALNDGLVPLGKTSLDFPHEPR